MAVDQNGWELSIFNVATGPSNILARQVALTAANGTAVGSFGAIGTWDPGQPDNLVYPQTVLSDGVPMTSTILGDNATTSATFNFTDTFLLAEIAGGNDQTVHIWKAVRQKTSAGGKSAFIYSLHSGTIWSVAWSPDGQHIASTSEDGTVHVWQAM